MCNSITYDTITNFINDLPTKDKKIIDYSISRFFNDFLIMNKRDYSPEDIQQIVNDYNNIQKFTNPTWFFSPQKFFWTFMVGKFYL